jgi:uncharacterized protein YndB with AHSA1/START domain
VIEIVRERRVEAPAQQVWGLVEDPGRLPEWFTFAERVELLEGEGVGRRQRMHGRWGKKRSEVDQVIVKHEPGRLLAWRHEAERLDGKPAPRFAAETHFAVRLDSEEGGTRVRLESRQEPASALRGVVMRLLGTREIAGHMERSLDRLQSVVTK